MKQFISALLALGMLLALWGCGQKPKAPSSTASVAPTTTGPRHCHSYASADCTTPRTCTDCGYTSGKALGHDYVESTCARCGQEDKTYRPLVGSEWTIDCVSEDGSRLERITLRFAGDGTALLSAGIYDRLSNVPQEPGNDENWYDYSGVIYDYTGYEVTDSLLYTVDGNAITCTLAQDESLQLILERIGGNMLQVTYFDEGFSIVYLLVDDVLSCQN